MASQNGNRIWVDIDQRISDRICIKKLASYEAPWTYLLNGNNVREETGIKFDDSLTFESCRKVSSLAEASEILISKIKEYQVKLFCNDGVYLVHFRIEPDSNGIARGEGLAYTPFYVVQALVDVRKKIQ